MQFDMNTIWSRGMALVSENFQLLAIIAGVFLLLPSVLIYLMVPDFASMIDPSFGPSDDPEAVIEMMSAMIGPLVLWGLVGMVFQFAGYGAMVSLMGSSRPTVGEAIATGFKTTPSVFGVLIIFILGYFLAAMAVLVPIGLIAAAIGLPGLAAVGTFLIFPIVIFLMARMSMSMPVIVLEETLNPFTAVKRSWNLTKPNQWAIIGFWLILGVAYMVISLLLMGVFGMLAALTSGAAGSALVLGMLNGIIGMAVGMIVCGLAVAMFGQLAGPGLTEVSETFE